MSHIENIYNPDDATLFKIIEEMIKTGEINSQSLFHKKIAYDLSIKFPINIDLLVKLNIYSKKGGIKIKLERDFLFDIDYQITKNLNTINRGGKNKEIITITLECFRIFCLKKPSKKDEKNISNKLSKQLNGKREVRINDGNRIIDILTDEYIIEVKNDVRKLEAVGQILYYSNFYPDKKKRIHLFDWERKDKIYENICKKLDILLTYE